MTNEMKHTPTTVLPWQVGKTDVNGLYRIQTKTEGINAMEALVGRIYLKEDAAYIVRAVNAHDELLMNLRFLVDAVKNGSHADMEIAIRKSDQALAQAEGR